MTWSTCEPPVLFGDKLARLERERVTENTTEDDLGWTETSDGIGSVPVYEEVLEVLEDLVSVQAVGLRSVASDDSLGMFDSKLCPLVDKLRRLGEQCQTWSINPRTHWR